MQTVSDILVPNRDFSKDELEAGREFVSGTQLKRYIIGKNDASETLINMFPITGIIDDYSPPGTLWKNIKIVKSSDVEKDAIVVNCASSISPCSAHTLLLDLGIRKTISFAVVCDVLDTIPQPFFVQEFRKDFEEHTREWNHLHTLFKDELSLKTFFDIVNFRFSGDHRYMADYSVRFKEQYFDPIVKVGPEEVLVDCGGYDGDTCMEFIRRYKHYKKIYLFEPSLENFNRAKANLAPYADIELIPSGVSDTAGELFFDAGKGSASQVNEQGSSSIHVESIDSYIKDKVTFIKMDIEGWEMKALKGAENHIRNDHPKLAIAVYHHASDFWKIPEFVLSIRNDYRVYLRHYSEGWSETVMYFI